MHNKFLSLKVKLLSSIISKLKKSKQPLGSTYQHSQQSASKQQYNTNQIILMHCLDEEKCKPKRLTNAIINLFKNQVKNQSKQGQSQPICSGKIKSSKFSRKQKIKLLIFPAINPNFTTFITLNLVYLLLRFLGIQTKNYYIKPTFFILSPNLKHPNLIYNKQD